MKRHLVPALSAGLLALCLAANATPVVAGAAAPAGGTRLGASTERLITVSDDVRHRQHRWQPAKRQLQAKDVALRAAVAEAATARAFKVGHLIAGQPLRWNPCAPIHWASHTSTGPADGLAVLQSAVARVASTTGTSWVYDGEIVTQPTSNWLDSHNSVLLGWSTRAGSDLLSRSTEALGTAQIAFESDGHSSPHIAAGVIALDQSAHLPLTGNGSWRLAALHELGHVMGLGHVSGEGQAMAPVLSTSISDYQAGDLNGLRTLGARSGCL